MAIKKDMSFLKVAGWVRRMSEAMVVAQGGVRPAARVGVVIGALLVVSVTPAYAAPKDLNAVIDGIRTFAMGVLFTLTTLYLTVAGIRYVLAGGSPHAMEEAKTAVKNSLLGYALAALAPLLADIVKGIVG
jgi:hypothetical protein